jgi:hypothetical protein
LLRRKALGPLEDAAARVTETRGATPQRHDDRHVLGTGGRGFGIHARSAYTKPARAAPRTPLAGRQTVGNGEQEGVSYCTQEQEEAGFGVGSMSVSKTKGEQ